MKYAIPLSKNQQDINDYEYVFSLYEIINSIKFLKPLHNAQKIWTPPNLAKVTWMKVPGFSSYVVDDSTSKLDVDIDGEELLICEPS